MASIWKELVWDGLLWLVMCLHVFLSPFTKVEESFNLQACHDALIHGPQLHLWDHLQFPGAVPRSFLGALATSVAAYPFLGLGAVSKPALLRLVRLVVASTSALCFARFRFLVAKEWGIAAGRLLALLTVTQFHLPFYLSRTLPNVFATQLALLAHAEMLSKSPRAAYRCLALLGITAAVFRCDLLIMIAPVGLLLLWHCRVNFFKAAAVTAAAALLGACLSICVDSILWRRWLWPEFEVLWFNTAENKSSEWGTQPPLWYFYSALPRALLGSLPLALLALLIEPRARQLVAVALTFIGLYSFLPHKELRFIFPALPLLNAAAAAAGARVLRWKRCGVLLWGGFALALAAHVLVTTVMTLASFCNYPGGVAMTGLHATDAATNRSVHIGNMAAISGVSRFLERPDWQYSKEEGLDADALVAKGFDWLLSEFSEVPGYHCVAATEGFQGLSRSWPLVRLAPQIYLHSKSAASETRCDATWNAMSHAEFQVAPFLT
ncbi:unnamed protein product [Effrenium voratum]|nr:unnamed protein product [Effrenium voratum]